MLWVSKIKHWAGTHFSTINSCYVDTKNVYTIRRMNGYLVTIDQKQNAMGQQKFAMAQEPVFRPSIVAKKTIDNTTSRVTLGTRTS